MSKLSIRAFGIAATLCATTASGASVDDFTGLVVLGDSLSDLGRANAISNGALASDPPYFEGRFSDGPIWVDYFASDALTASEPGFSFAVGGATAVDNGDFLPDLDIQTEELLGDAEVRALIGDNPLLALWFGGNDLRAFIGGPDEVILAERTAEAIGDAGLVLLNEGFDDILLFNLPDLGRIPLYALANPDLAAEATLATQAFNVAIADQADVLRDAGATVFEVDIAGIFDALLADPLAFDITQPFLPCVIQDQNLEVVEACPDSTGFLFFDALHPTTQVHAIISDVAIDAIDGPTPVPLPATIALLMAGLGAVGSLRVVGRRA
ncbi:SGNH/GDSL hydrolase family protein [Jannaschia sp. LMIT008]|uniref:SGNH/GDSL hydrolase family protein n=1 Tax=Jannaschia maritima TaxID=3032585 RepID=UPI0028116382|nr:SGNH/GDSL hydrolase family protein [Jannaschia sp. LMIT008]